MVGLSKDIMILHLHAKTLHAKTQSILHSTQNNILFSRFVGITPTSVKPISNSLTSTSLTPRISDTSLVPSQVYPKTTLSWDDPSRSSTRNWSSSLVPSQVYPKMTLSKRTFTYPQWIIDISASFPDWDFPTIFFTDLPLTNFREPDQRSIYKSPYA